MIVYLTGGIGTGKSTVLRMFADLGATTLAADDIVRDLYDSAEVQHRVAEATGLAVPLERADVAKVVFSDPDALLRVEAILHPLVAARLTETAAAQSDPVIYEIPLPPRSAPGDTVIRVEAPLALRRSRLGERGMAATDVERRIAAQPDSDEYGKHATYVIVNDGDVRALRTAVEHIWEELHRGTSAV